MKPGERTRERIMETGCDIWPNVSCRAIARKLGITHCAVLYHYSTVEALRAAIADYAVRNERARVIAQLIATDHTAVRDMPAAERARYLGELTA